MGLHAVTDRNLVGVSSSEQQDLASFSDEAICQYCDDSAKSFGDWITEQEEEARMSQIRLPSLEKLTEGLPSMSVVLGDIEPRLASIETATPNNDEHAAEEKRQEDLVGTTGIFRRDANGMLMKAVTASRMTGHRHQEFV